MASSDELFPQLPSDDDEGVETLNVRQVAERLTRALDRIFPQPFWLTGEASGLARARGGRAGHWYFKLVEAEPESASSRASLDVIMWKSTVSRLFGSRGRLRGSFEPEDGAVLRVRVKPNYYAPQGKLSFVIDDVDPSFTLGDLERRRRELLAKLALEGALERNAQQPLPDPPLRLGLITSVGSAAYEDVRKQLLPSGIGFQLKVCDARTQGADSARSVVAALRTLQRLPLDAILLVRGGGSRLDLAGFDDEAIARAIADCTLPVLTGIGHEIDRSVADEVAHTSFKTPTAVAAWVIERAEAARAAVEDGFLRVREFVVGSWQAEHVAVEQLAGALRRATRVRLAEEQLALGRASRRFAQRAEVMLARADEGLAAARRRLEGSRGIENLGRLDSQLLDARERLRRHAERNLDRQAEVLTEREQRLRLLDPAQVLRRGYAYLKRADGAVLMDAAAARKEESLRVVLRDGELEVQAVASHPRALPKKSS
ncbi:MAG: exodeoxyribonuclease 7 large subunit [Planctomycetota bacterium]|nr:MAG: exodeoxyribonuclease 7 large subunit [Planctomycetota bacterium]